MTFEYNNEVAEKQPNIYTSNTAVAGGKYFKKENSAFRKEISSSRHINIT